MAKNLVNNNKAAKQFSRLPTYSIVEMRRKYRCQLYLVRFLKTNDYKLRLVCANSQKDYSHPHIPHSVLKAVLNFAEHCTCLLDLRMFHGRQYVTLHKLYSTECTEVAWLVAT